MATYVYRSADGRLYSWTPDDGDAVASDQDLAANGLAKVTGLPVLDATHQWDEASRTVLTTAAARVARPIGTPKWILRFTGAEMTAIRASTNLDVQHLLFALGFSYEIDRNDPDVVNGVALLVTLGLVDQSRVNAILE